MMDRRWSAMRPVTYAPDDVRGPELTSSVAADVVRHALRLGRSVMSTADWASGLRLLLS
jgi:hypothetical protein